MVQKLAQSEPDELATTIINQAELLFGAYHSEQITKKLSSVKNFLQHLKVLPFDENSAEIFAQIKSQLQKNGTPVADLDLMIASICLANQATLVSNNTKHFARIENLDLENWIE